jgi:hypothetical protein
LARSDYRAADERLKEDNMKTLVRTLAVAILVPAANVSAQTGTYYAQGSVPTQVVCVGQPSLTAQKRVVSCTLARDSSFFQPGNNFQIFCKGGAGVTFDTDAHVTSCTLVQPNSAHAPGNSGVTVICKAGDVINFDATGAVTSCALFRDSNYLPISGSTQILCRAGTVVSFDAGGRVISCNGPSGSTVGGSSSKNTTAQASGQYGAAAASACTGLANAMSKIAKPTTKADIVPYLTSVHAALKGYATRLHAIAPPDEVKSLHVRALGLADRVVELVFLARLNIQNGADPAAAWNAVQKEFDAIGADSDAIWKRLGVAACVG